MALRIRFSFCSRRRRAIGAAAVLALLTAAVIGLGVVWSCASPRLPLRRVEGREGATPAGREGSPRLSGVSTLELSVEDAEVVATATAGGRTLLYVTSPAPACEDSGSSFLSVLALGPLGPDDVEELHGIDLGPGECTSVAIAPGGRLAAASVKDPQAPGTRQGRLLIVEGTRVAGSVPVGPGPDSVAITPDGRFAVVACEAEEPDDDDCPAERPADDVPGSVVIVDLAGGAAGARVAAVVTGRTLFERAFRDEPGRALRPEDIEPEFVATAPDGTYALVTLQEQSAVAAVLLAPLRDSPAGGEAPGDRGERLLASVVLLPHGVRDRKGTVRGTHPDGLAVSRDGTLAVTANEAHSRAAGLQGITFLDLRGGPAAIRIAATHSVFDLDATLAAADRSAKPRKLSARRSKPPKAAAIRKLPRLDPEGVALAQAGGVPLLAVAIERRAPLEESGSVLLLDVGGVLDGAPPRRLDRRVVGASPGARPETLEFALDGRLLIVACEKDGGALTFLEVE